MKKLLFITGTRADYGKIKPLMSKVKQMENVKLQVFVTGMHMISKYGSTYLEIEKDGFENLYKYINQTENSNMDIVLSNTIVGISNYINEYAIDMIVIHGDRIEALAGAIVGALNNIRVAHIEGGEVSGTIDESIRHAITKFSHLHFVSNEEAKKRLLQLGEREETIFTIGSPDIDVMSSDKLPSLDEAKRKYDISFNDYALLIYHPVTTEASRTKEKVDKLVEAIIQSGNNYIVIYPNNDHGSNLILESYEKFHNNPKIRVFPSIRFEYFLTLLKNASFIIGNSSAGIREARHFLIPVIDLGIRQQGRYKVNDNGILHSNEEIEDILRLIENIETVKVENDHYFGDGQSSERFIKTLCNEEVWTCNIQKKFIDIVY
ncbi:MAG: UDP-N-acetylglucosamine 2-epimerase [Clostridia bacterium]|nr:UDP-N-acetylglucosamine 2-epimerase [Clostridia bacterium]